MATKITIGDKEYSVPELNFCGIERAWPYVDKAMASLDVIQGAAAGICIIAAGIVEAEDFRPSQYDMEDPSSRGELNEADRDLCFDVLNKRLKRQLKATEMQNIADAVNSIMVEAGLVAQPGELPVKGESPSTETSDHTSQSSLPLDAPVATGSE